MSEIFPPHIYDPTRIQIATELLQKEFGKLLPSADTASINRDIVGWWSKPEDFKLAAVFDFWDTVEAVIGGIKLKSLSTMITARNYSWAAEKIKTKDILLRARLEQLNRLENLGEDLSLLAIGKILDENPTAKAEQKKLIDNFSRDAAQNNYKIIAERSGDKFKAHDGNRRALRALIYDQAEIDVWILDEHGQEPRDYWVPIEEMLRLVKLFRHNAHDEELSRGIKAVLATYFETSEVAKIAYRHRIIDWGVPGSKQLAEGLL